MLSNLPNRMPNSRTDCVPSWVRTSIFFALLSVTLLSLNLLGLMLPLAHADYIAPDQVVVKTEAYTPKDTSFATGSYQYAVNWQGIPVGVGSITVTPGEMPDSNGTGLNVRTLSVRASAQTTNVVRLFYTLKHVSESMFRADNMTPMIFSLVQTENSRTKSRDVQFSPGGLVNGKLYNWKNGVSTPDEEHVFQTSNPILDPITAIFYARSLDVDVGQSVSFDVFNGKHRFLISLQKGPLSIIKVNGVNREAYSVTPTVKKLTDSEGETRLRKATIWISNDGRRDILKIESEVLVGSIRVELTSFVPGVADQRLPDDAARAALQSPPEAGAVAASPTASPMPK